MATYREIKGFTVQSLSTDPSLSSGNEGQVWFNSTSGKLKGLVQIGAWASAADVTTLRSHCGGAGTQTAGLIFGGVPYTGATEEFNGTGWATAANSLNTARGSMGSLGTSTAALFMGGDTAPAYVKVVEEYNGTVWSEENDIPTAITDICGIGIQTAGLACGGNSPLQSAVNLYDGTSWAAETAMPAARDEAAGSGTSTAALVAGGHSPGNTTTTIEYDGTSWTTGGALTAAQAAAGCSKAGTQTAAIIFGGMTGPGAPSVVTTTAQYDGTAWTATGSMGAAKRYPGCGGSSTAAFVACGMGVPPTKTTTAEIFNQSINVTTAGAWASGNNPANGRQWASGAGTTSAGIMFGGLPRVSPTPTCEEFDGTNWAAGGAYNATDATNNGGGAGTQTATLGWAGVSPGATVTTTTNTYNGTAWAASPAAMGTARYQFSCAGTETAALMMGGRVPGRNSTATEEFDGTSWAAGGALNTGTETGAGGPQGSQTSAVIFGGIYPSASSQTETYDGTSWTASGATLFEAGHGQAAAGTSSSPMLAAGSAPNPGSPYALVTCQAFDGSAWSTTPSLATATAGSAGMGTPASMITAGGRDASANALAQTQEFTGSTDTATASNITSS